MRPRGDLGKAREILEEGMVVGREVGDPELLAAFLTKRCDTFSLQGDLERATVVGEKAVAICREHKYRGVPKVALQSRMGSAAPR